MLMSQYQVGIETLMGQTQAVNPGNTKLLHNEMIQKLKLWEYSLGSHHHFPKTQIL